jgi:hypothetical protein
MASRVTHPQPQLRPAAPDRDDVTFAGMAGASKFVGAGVTPAVVGH